MENDFEIEIPITVTAIDIDYTPARNAASIKGSNYDGSISDPGYCAEVDFNIQLEYDGIIFSTKDGKLEAKLKEQMFNDVINMCEGGE